MKQMFVDLLKITVLFFKYLTVWIALQLGYKKILKRNTWLLAEKKTEARDNGYHMFKYLKSLDIKDDVYYGINFTSPDYNKLKGMGNVVKYDTFMHLALYLGSKYIVSSNYDAKPYESQRGIYKLNVFRRKDQIRVNLTHGIIKDEIPSAHDPKLVDYQLLICGTRPSYDFCKKRYSYEDDKIALTGLCRFDALIDTSKEKVILVMPTFREWLRTDNSSKKEASAAEKDVMKHSQFFERYISFMNNEHLSDLLRKKNAKLLFYLHYTIQPYTNLFKASVDNQDVIICKRENFDVQELLKSSSILITDYSSVAFDFAYMRKPLAYYQFDYEKYRGDHYKEGFFSYERDGLGPVFKEEPEIIDWLQDVIDVEPGEWDFKERCVRFFPFRDSKCCERVYNAVIKLSKA